MKTRFICALLVVAVLLSATAINVRAQEVTVTYPYKTIAAGISHSLAIKSDGSLWGWGNNNYGQLGDGTAVEYNPRLSGEPEQNNRLKPVRIMSDVVSVAAGGDHSLAIKTDKSLWSWGSNSHGQIGDGSKTVYGVDEYGYGIIKEDNDRLLPVKIMDNVVFAAAGVDHSFAIKEDGSLWAWGSNSHNQLGDGGDMDRSKPIKIMDNIIFVAAGEYHSLAITTNGDVWAWGYNNYGQVGDGTYMRRSTPVKIMNKGTSASLGGRIGWEHNLAIRTDGGLWTWGSNNYGQLGNGTDDDMITPEKIMDNAAFAATGDDYSFAIKTDGSLWAWGSNTGGQLGDGTITTYDDEGWDKTKDGDKLKPVKIMDKAASIDAGYGHSLAIKTDGSLWVWGNNGSGQLGDGTITTTTYNSNGRRVIKEDNGKLIPLKIMDNVMLPKTVTVSFTIQTNSATAYDNPSGWAEVDVATAIDADLVPPFLQSKYSQATTRAEFCALAVTLYEMVKGQKITENAYFFDTDDLNVKKAATIGVVNGVGNLMFAPDDQLTREQAATMLSRLADALGKPLAKHAASFTDNGKVSAWALEAVGQMQTTGIMDGIGNNTFAPKNPYTREQSIITILRLYNDIQ